MLVKQNLNNLLGCIWFNGTMYDKSLTGLKMRTKFRDIWNWNSDITRVLCLEHKRHLLFL